MGIAVHLEHEDRSKGRIQPSCPGGVERSSEISIRWAILQLKVLTPTEFLAAYRHNSQNPS
jgi:hypothetical protein